MTVTEIKQALGSWNLRLRADTPRSVLDALTFLGHVVVAPGTMDPVQYGDNLLTAARYVGVYRSRSNDDDIELSGSGMAYWLGDEDDKGSVFETPVVLAAQTFATSVAALLPPGGSVTAGTIFGIAGTYTGTHQWETPRSALNYLTEMFSAEWRVTGDGKLDAGLVSDLYLTTPRTLLYRKAGAGKELTLVGIPGKTSLARDVEDYTTRVVLLAEGEGASIATGSADAGVVPYKDIHGNAVVLTRLVSESDTAATNATARAQLVLNHFSGARSAVTLSADAYDIKGDLVVGDYLAVYDPDNGFTDPANERYWAGQPINPLYLRCVEMSWPIPDGWTVAFRDSNGVWIDLSPYYIPEGGETSITVGDFSSSLTGIGSQPVGDRPSGDSSIPGVPVFGTAYSAAYESNAINDVKAAVQLSWTQPLNTDGSTIIDGDHYEIRYRVTNTYSYPITWNQASLLRWNQVQTWGRPLSNPAASGGNWTSVYVPWGQLLTLINELSVAVQYEFQIRAVDNASPQNVGAFSGSLFITTSGDVLAPSTPAAPTVAASRLGIQVVHLLGKNTGGTFNLENDLNHLEVHVGGEAFFPDDSTRVGRLPANSAHLIGKIPIVGTFALENTSDVWVRIVAVDRTGNRSPSSPPVQSSIMLIDNAHISDLSVSKITAGSITADWIIAAALKTAAIGQRVEINSTGIQAYNNAGDLVTNINADPGTTGQFVGFRDSLGMFLASIDNVGAISGQNLYAANEVYVAGEALIADTIGKRPKGIVAWGNTSLDKNATGAGTETGYIEIAFNAEAGRKYRIQCVGDVESNSGVATEKYLFRFRDGGALQPTISSTNLGGNQFPCTPSAGVNTTGFDVVIAEFTPGLHRILWTFFAFTGVATMRGSDGPSYMWVEDLGDTSLFTNIAQINDGSGSPVFPVGTQTKIYTPVWVQSYEGNSTTGTNGTNFKQQDLWQGDDGGGYGNGRALAGFDYSKIMDDLNGATILACSIRLYAFRWKNSTGTAVIGTHDYTSRPAVWNAGAGSVNSNRFQSASWPKAAFRTIDLGIAIGQEFQSGVSKGIAVGPGISTAAVYSGTFEGYVGDAAQPVLRISYVK